MGADASFIARTMDRDPKHIQKMLWRAQQHHGTSFLEIYQNCNIFNDGAFAAFTDKGTKAEETLFLDQGQPLVFGVERNKGIRLDGHQPQIVDLGQDYSLDDLWVHEETDLLKAQILVRFFDETTREGRFPRPFGVLYARERPTYEEEMDLQIEEAIAVKGPGNLDKLLQGKETWNIA